MERSLNRKEEGIVKFLVDYVEDAWRSQNNDIFDAGFDDPRSLYELSEFFDDQDFDEDDDDIDYDLVDAAAFAGVEELREQRRLEDEEDDEAV